MGFLYIFYKFFNRLFYYGNTLKKDIKKIGDQSQTKTSQTI